MNKKIISIILAIGMALQLGGCSGNMMGKDKLNDRQKKILVEKGLSSDWSDLNYSQKKSITAIEEMLEYLEDKYDKKFEYSGYNNGQTFGDKERLIAVAEGDNPIYDGVSVWRDKSDKSKLKDDYATVLMLKELREDAGPFLEETLNGADYMMYLDSFIKDDKGGGLAWGNVEIHVRASQIEDEDTKAIYRKLWGYFEPKSRDLMGVFFYVVKDGKFDEEYQIGYPEMFGDGDTVQEFVKKSDYEGE